MASIPVRSVSDHGVQFLWHSHRAGTGILDPFDMTELFAQGFPQRGRQVRLDSMSDPHGPGCRVQLGKMRPVLLTILLDEGPASAPEVLSMDEVPWRRVGGHLALIPGADVPVVLGFLAWMYGHEPATMRRLLENRLASKGSSIVSIALRLFELGWHLGPGWAPFRCCWSPSYTERPEPEEDAVEEHLRYRKLTTTGGRALAHGALAAGLNRCSHSPFHPLVEPFVYEFRRGGGTLERNARDDVVARPARPTDSQPDGGPRLVVHVAGEPLPRIDGRERHVVLRIDRVPLSFRSSSFDFPHHSTGLTGLQTPPSAVLVPSSVNECYEFVRIAGRIVREWDRDVTILVDSALLSAEGPLRIGPEPSPMMGEGIADGPMSPMNCRAFAPSVISPNSRKRTKSPGVAGSDGGGMPVAGVEKVLPYASLFGDQWGEVLVVSWGAGREGVQGALERWRQRGLPVSGFHVTALSSGGHHLFDLFSGFSRIVLLETDGSVTGDTSEPGTMGRLLQDRLLGTDRAVLPGEWPEQWSTPPLETWTLSGEPGMRSEELVQELGSALQVRA